MLLTFSLEERLDPIGQDEDPVGPVPRAAPSSWPLATTLRTVASALREGLLALRRYEHLRSRGVADDLALRMAIGVPHASSDIRPAARRPRVWAARASPTWGDGAALHRQVALPEQVAQPGSSARVADLAYAHGA